MLRFLSAALCALPIAMPLPAGAQSYISVAEKEIAVRAPLAPPMSLMQRYVPNALSQERKLSMLVGDHRPTPPSGAVSVTSPTPEPVTRVAVNERGIGRGTIVISNVRGLDE